MGDSLNKGRKTAYLVIFILGTVFFLTGLIFFKHESFEDIFAMICILVFGLQYGFYKPLQDNHIYLLLLFISALIAGFGILYFGRSDNVGTYFVMRFSLLPLNFLLVQRPLRFVFIKLMKQEPEVEKFTTFSNYVYMSLLVGIPFLLFYGRGI